MYEVHITVDNERFQSYALRNNYKWLFIILSRGKFPWQPMFSFKRKTKKEVDYHVNKIKRELSSHVLRIKIEQDINEYKEGTYSNGYYENHIKLLLNEHTDLLLLESQVYRYGGKLSNNAIRRRSKGKLEQFVTQRTHNVTKVEAATKFDELVAWLDENNYKIIDIEREYVIYDSNYDLDKDWL